MNPYLVHIIIIIACDVSGVLAAKSWSITKNPLLLVTTVLLFGTAGFVFARSLRYNGVAITNILWISLSIILVTIIGYFFFKEDISLIQFIGIALIFSGLVLINLK